MYFSSNRAKTISRIIVIVVVSIYISFNIFYDVKEVNNISDGVILSKQGVKTAVGFRPLPTFEQLINKFDEHAPVTKVVPECLTMPTIHSLAIPTILMSLGRSGSTVIMNTLNNLTGTFGNQMAVELTGQNLRDSNYFFNRSISAEEKFECDTKNMLKRVGAQLNEVPGKNNSLHGEWLINYICRKRRFPKQPPRLIGFKFKPSFWTFMAFSEARESLQVLASLASAAEAVGQKPPIVVVRSRRNSMDVLLSNMKHMKNTDLSTWCDKSDAECVEEMKHDSRQFVGDVDFFVQKVRTEWGQESLIDQLLEKLKVPFVSVDYDTLFYPDDILDGEEQWNKMLRFISPLTKTPKKSWKEIQLASNLASTTTSRFHDELIQNWREVYDALKGTEVEHLFRLSNYSR